MITFPTTWLQIIIDSLCTHQLVDSIIAYLDYAVGNQIHKLQDTKRWIWFHNIATLTNNKVAMAKICESFLKAFIFLGNKFNLKFRTLTSTSTLCCGRCNNCINFGLHNFTSTRRLRTNTSAFICAIAESSSKFSSNIERDQHRPIIPNNLWTLVIRSSL